MLYKAIAKLDSNQLESRRKKYLLFERVWCEKGWEGGCYTFSFASYPGLNDLDPSLRLSQGRFLVEVSTVGLKGLNPTLYITLIPKEERSNNSNCVIRTIVKNPLVYKLYETEDGRGNLEEEDFLNYHFMNAIQSSFQSSAELKGRNLSHKEKNDIDRFIYRLFSKAELKSGNISEHAVWNSLKVYFIATYYPTMVTRKILSQPKKLFSKRNLENLVGKPHLELEK